MEQVALDTQHELPAVGDLVGILLVCERSRLCLCCLAVLKYQCTYLNDHQGNSYIKIPLFYNLSFKIIDKWSKTDK
jgi:hypothetical protein